MGFIFEVKSEVDLFHGLFRAKAILRDVQLDAQLLKQVVENLEVQDFVSSTTSNDDFLGLVVEVNVLRGLLTIGLVRKEHLVKFLGDVASLSETQDKVLGADKGCCTIVEIGAFYMLFDFILAVLFENLELVLSHYMIFASSKPKLIYILSELKQQELVCIS